MLKSLRAGDWVVLVMVVLGVSATAGFIGISNPIVIALLSIGWACPAARRLVAWRRGQSLPRRISADDLATTPILLFGAAPWALLPAMHAINPGAALLSTALPLQLRCLGGVLIVVGVLSPLWTARSHQRLFGRTSSFEAIGLLLMLGSVFFTVLALGVWLTSPTARRLAASPRPEPRPIAPELAFPLLRH